MRKLQIEDAQVMRIAIQQEIARSEESRYDHRLHGLLLVSAGKSCRQVAKLFDENSTTVQRWVNRFEHGGLDALGEGERSGRPRTLDATQWRKLQSDLRKPRPQVAQVDPLKIAAVKNSAVWLEEPTLNCGAWTNVIFSNTARAAACG